MLGLYTLCIIVCMEGACTHLLSAHCSQFRMMIMTHLLATWTPALRWPGARPRLRLETWGPGLRRVTRGPDTARATSSENTWGISSSWWSWEMWVSHQNSTHCDNMMGWMLLSVVTGHCLPTAHGGRAVVRMWGGWHYPLYTSTNTKQTPGGQIRMTRVHFAKKTCSCAGRKDQVEECLTVWKDHLKWV